MFEQIDFLDIASSFGLQLFQEASNFGSTVCGEIAPFHGQVMSGVYHAGNVDNGITVGNSPDELGHIPNDFPVSRMRVISRMMNKLYLSGD